MTSAVTKPALKGRGQLWLMGVAVTPKCKEGAYWKPKERGEFWVFNQKCCDHHVLYVGCNVTNAFYSANKGNKGSLGACSQKIVTSMFFTMLENAALHI